MSVRISNPSGDHGDKIDNAAEVIGKSKDALEFFTAVYTKKQQIKTIDDVLSMTSISNNVRVLQVGKKLASHDMVELIKDEKTGLTTYKKIDFYAQNRNKIVSMVNNPKTRENFATKSRPKVTVMVQTKGSISPPFSIETMSINNIDAFKKATKIKSVKKISPLEKNTKELFKKVLGDSGNFTDWGGETDDLFTTKLKINGKRYHVAFGLKGRGTKGVLTPKKMGKNGDQVQRLFRSPAQVFLIQYNDQISSSIIEQMRDFAIAKSAKENRKIFYGIIDGDDTAKIFAAYSN